MKIDNNKKLLALVVLVGLIQVFLTRRYFLDDAFIHLRIAESIYTNAFVSFNGGIKTYSTSSSLYTILIAVIQFLYNGIYATKILSILFYLCILILLVCRNLKSDNKLSKIATLIWLSILVTPLSVRWLTDGMETSLIAFIAIILGKIAYSNEIKINSILIFILGIICVTLRIEFLFIIFYIFFIKLILYKLDYKKYHNIFFILMGAFVGILLLNLYYGYLLPDTAIAKTPQHLIYTPFNIISYLTGIIISHLSSSMFGIGSLALLVGTFIFSLKNSKRKNEIILVNISIIFVIIIMTIRQQFIQGFRYFIFIEFFIISYNIYEISKGKYYRFNANKISSININVKCKYIFALLLVIWFVFDYSRVYFISKIRVETLDSFLDKKLDFLAGTNGIAWDVGMIGYFTNATILDPNGLVNGRSIAKFNQNERIEYFVGKYKIDFIFANEAQLKSLEPYIDSYNWTLYNTYNFPNFSNNLDKHYLLIR